MCRIWITLGIVRSSLIVSICSRPAPTPRRPIWTALKIRGCTAPAVPGEKNTARGKRDSVFSTVPPETWNGPRHFYTTVLQLHDNCVCLPLNGHPNIETKLKFPMKPWLQWVGECMFPEQGTEPQRRHSGGEEGIPALEEMLPPPPDACQERSLLRSPNLTVLCSVALGRPWESVGSHPPHKETTTEMKWQPGAALATIWTAAERSTFLPALPRPFGPFSSPCKEPKKWLINGKPIFVWKMQ